MRQPGIYSDIDINEYHASAGISSSGITLLRDCPKRYHYEYIEEREIDPKEAKKEAEKYKMGRAVHMLVLEPEKFESTFYCMEEEVNLTTKIGKEIYAKAEAEANGREILRADKWKDIKLMSESIKAHSIWSKFRKEAKVEQSIFWNGGIFETPLRARPDVFNDQIVMEIKTTSSISNFSKSIYNFGYHRQAAMQVDGLQTVDGKQRKFAFFVVEDKAPYLTACFELDEMSLSQGREEYLDSAILYAECIKNNEWPGYTEDVQKISLPAWAFSKEEEST
jgi:exodeoxyribonuclease VIII